jgi:hypothetical protein
VSSSITIYPYNIYELGTPDITGTPDTGYPEERLFDRSKSFYWKDTASGAYTFIVDQSAGALDVDFLAICGHNFSGNLQWQYSATGAWAGEQVSAIATFSATTGQIVKTLGSPVNSDYWRFRVASATNPRATEIFMGGGYEFDAMANPSPVGGYQSKVSWQQTVGGDERATKRGELRRVRSYTVFISESDLASWRTCFDYTDAYSKPFFSGTTKTIIIWFDSFPTRWRTSTIKHIRISGWMCGRCSNDRIFQTFRGR